MRVFIFVVIALSICLLFLLLLRFFAWVKLQNRRREELRRQALNDFVVLHFPQSGFSCREQVAQEVRGAQDAGDVGEKLELRARRASFPIPASLPPREGREATISHFVTFITAAPFATAAGTGEQFFYSLFDGLKDTPFADTLSFLADYTGQQIAVGMHEAAGHVAPAVHQLWELLVHYYSDNPLEAAKLIYKTVEVITVHTQEQAFDLLKHVFDMGHLHVYGEAFAPVIHPIAEGLSHSATTAHEHLSHIDAHSFSIPHDAAVPHFHFPFITLALSATREIRLLSEEKTNIGNSLKNAGLDVAGTSVGGFGGAKLGAAIGTFVAPGPGTAIGGVIGGIIGALTGRLATNSVKEINLNRAKDAYDKRFSSMESKTTDGAHRLYNRASAAMSQSQEKYLKSIGNMQSLSNASLPIGPDVKKIAVAMRKDFGQCRETLHQAYLRSVALVPSDSWYHHLLGGAGAKQLKEQLETVYNEKDQHLQLGESQIPNDASCTSESLNALLQLASLQSPHSYKYEEQLAKVTKAVQLNKASYLSCLLVWARNATHHYQEAMKSAHISIALEAERFKDLCEQWKKDVQVAVADVQVELAKLGRT